MKYEKKFITSFDKSFSSNITYVQPEKYADIEKYSKNFKNLITFGSNFSYSPISFDKKSLVINLSKFNKIINFNKKKKEITVEAGIKIKDLLNFILKFNLWIPQLPGYPFISVGGAVAANIHGKSCGIDGTIKNSVKNILLFHKKHGWVNLSKRQKKDLFDLTIGGLGLTGTIVTVTFKLHDFKYTSFLTKRHEVKNITQTISCLNKLKNKKNSYIYSWNDASSSKNFGRGFVYINTPVKRNIKNTVQLNFKKKYNRQIPLWNKYTLKIFNFIFFNLQKNKKKKIEENFQNTIFPFAGNENYFNFYGKKGFIESQLIIKKKVIKVFFKEFKKYYKIFNPDIVLFSLKNMSGKQKLIRFEREGICVTFDFIRNKKNLDFLKKIDALCVKFDVLPSIIKDSRITKKIFDKCYINSDLFRKKLLKFDKNRVYQSEVSRRLKI